MMIKTDANAAARFWWMLRQLVMKSSSFNGGLQQAENMGFQQMIKQKRQKLSQTTHSTMETTNCNNYRSGKQFSKRELFGY
jgi:3-mercaptopyruvate sulfurtransferase SseA